MCVYCLPSHHHEVAARESAPSNGYLRVAVFFVIFPEETKTLARAE